VTIRRNERFVNRDLVKKFHDNYVRTLPVQNTSLRLIQQQIGVSKAWDTLFTYQSVSDGEVDRSFWSWLEDEKNDFGVQVRK
jgi:hypothetical protein